MTRYMSMAHIVSWQPQDVVSMELVYEKHRESYRNLAINGKPPRRAWRLAGRLVDRRIRSVLADVFSPATAAISITGESPDRRGVPP